VEHSHAPHPLETIISSQKTFQVFEIDYLFLSIDHGIIVINLRKVYSPGNSTSIEVGRRYAERGS